MTEANRLYEELRDAVQPSIVGHEELLELLTVGLFARGHVLVGGWPDAESVQVASTFATAMGLSSERVRLTPDADETDLRGRRGSIVDGDEPPGGAFARNVLLAADLNRAPPRVQSALVTAVEEGSVPVRGTTVELPRPFMVVGTLNPIESDEVYGLSAGVRDRFLFQLQTEDLDFEEARQLLDRHDRDETLGADDVEPIAAPEDVLATQEDVGTTYVDASIKEYLLEVVLATRDHPDVEYGAPTRSALPMLRAVKSFAALRGRDFAIPDDVRAVAVPALAPRLVLTTEAEIDDVEPRAVARDVLDTVTPPGTEIDADVPPVEERQFE